MDNKVKLWNWGSKKQWLPEKQPSLCDHCHVLIKKHEEEIKLFTDRIKQDEERIAGLHKQIADLITTQGNQVIEELDAGEKREARRGRPRKEKSDANV